MYLDFYNLKERPFSLTPDPAFLYYSRAHRRAIAFLQYGLRESKGFLQLTGPVGSGKTTLLRAILAQLDEKTKTAYIINPVAPFPDLLRSIMRDLEIPKIPDTRAKIELLDFFQDYLLVQQRRAAPVIVIFDEAQNLSLKNLEEIRMLSNFETTKGKLLQIAFVGQPELVKTLDRPELKQLQQRIQVRYHLSALYLPEVKAYIDHRLRVAGSDGEIVFTNDACKAIYDFSGGIPRLVNSVCDVTLLIGYVNERRKFDKATVEEALREMSGAFDDEPAGGETENTFSVANEEVGVVESENTTGSEPHRPPPPPSAEATNEPSPVCGRDTEASSKEEHRDSICQALVESRASFNAVKKRQEAPEAKTKQRPSAVPADDTADSGMSADNGKFCSTGEASPSGSGEADEKPTPASFRMKLKGLAASVTEKRGSFVLKRKRIAPKPSNLPNAREVRLRNRFNDGERSTQPVAVAFKRKTRLSKGRPIARRRVRPQKKSAGREVVIVYKNGSVRHGVIRNLDLTAAGFDYSPWPSRNGAGTEFAAFEKIAAVRLVGNFDNSNSHSRGLPKSKPKGRQIVVTLADGEVIEGITLSRFDPACQRFFLLSTNDNGDVSWVLVERSGTAGILTGDFREGIYAEEFEVLDRSAKAESGGQSTCANELTGDLYFSLGDYNSALLEYQKARANGAETERVRLKISLSHFNRGIKYMRTNRFDDARKEFEEAAREPRLLDKARAKVEKIKRLSTNLSST